MAGYQNPQDLAYAESLIKFAPKEADAFFNLKHTAERGDGVIPQKYRELMSIAVALTTQCGSTASMHMSGMRSRRCAPARRSRRPYSLPRHFAQAVPSGTACSRCVSSTKRPRTPDHKGSCFTASLGKRRIGGL